jgi:hypothetical protein
VARKRRPVERRVGVVDVVGGAGQRRSSSPHKCEQKTQSANPNNMASSCLSSPSTHLRRGGCCSCSARTSSSSRGPFKKISAFTVRVESSGKAIEVTEDEWTVGSDAKASLQLGTAPAVEAIHVKLTQKTRRRMATQAGASAQAAPAQVFLTALANVEDGVLGESRAWLDGTPLRPGVQYVLGNGQRVELGAATAGLGAVAFFVDFSEASGRDPMVEMMMQGLAGGGSAGDKLRDALK